MQRDIADWDFQHAALTRLLIERNRAELGFSAVHTRGAMDWWEVMAEFPDAARVELDTNHLELPVQVSACTVTPAFNEHVPDQRILDLAGVDWTGLHVRIRFSEVVIHAESRVMGTGWSKEQLPADAFVLADLTMSRGTPNSRHQPIASGYRPDWWTGDYHESWKSLIGGELFLLGREFLFPGETAPIAIRPTTPESWANVTVGSTIEMCEGSRVVGVATVRGLKRELGAP